MVQGHCKTRYESLLSVALRAVVIWILPNLSHLLMATDDWKIVWRDEFNGSRLNSDRWEYTIGGTGFGNNELEYYTDRPRNVSVRRGMQIGRAHV